MNNLLFLFKDIKNYMKIATNFLLEKHCKELDSIVIVIGYWKIKCEKEIKLIELLFFITTFYD